MRRLANDAEFIELMWLSLDLPGTIFRYTRGLQLIRFEQLRGLLRRVDIKLTVIELFVEQDRIIVFVIKPGESQPILIECPCPEDRFKYLMNTYYREIIEYPRYGNDYTWLAVASRLLGEVLPLLLGADLVCIIPHHELSYLPLHILQFDGRYLIEDFPIFYAPNVRILIQTLERAVLTDEALKLHSFLVVGNPTFDLEDAEEEAKWVANYFGVEAYLGRDATKVKIRSQLADKDLIHLACHGFFRANDPLESGLMMAGKRALNINDLRVAQAHADLVILSSCESGLSVSFLPGEAIGLPVAFLDSGASSVLGTLWRVADKSTTLLVSDFYRRLYDRAGNKINTKARALQQAILAIRKHKEHPYYWAAFTLTGSWR